MTAPVYDHGLLTDAIYWQGASKAICAALNAGDLNEVGRLVKHYADLSHAEEMGLDAASADLRSRVAVVPVVSSLGVHPIFEAALADMRRLLPGVKP